MWIVITIIILIFAPQANAAIYINEISPSTNPEWIELYNDGTTTIDLTNWKLEDGNSSGSDDLTLSGSISANGYLVFSHNDGWLNNTGDTVKLYNNATPSAQLIDQYTYGSVSAEKSIARAPSGSENWVLGPQSQGVVNVTPAPSSSPSPSPIPSPSLSPSPSPQPVSPTPTPKPSPKPTLTPSPTPDLSPSPMGTVAGEAVEIDLSAFTTPTMVPSPQSSPSLKPTINKSRARTAILVGCGLILISLSGILLYHRLSKDHIINE